MVFEVASRELTVARQMPSLAAVTAVNDAADLKGKTALVVGGTSGCERCDALVEIIQQLRLRRRRRHRRHIERPPRVSWRKVDVVDVDGRRSLAAICHGAVKASPDDVPGGWGLGALMMVVVWEEVLVLARADGMAAVGSAAAEHHNRSCSLQRRDERSAGAKDGALE